MGKTKSSTEQEESASAGPIKTHLAVIFKVATLGGEELAPLVSFLSREGLNEWAKAVAPLFPGASNQELVALAMLPESVTRAVTKALKSDRVMPDRGVQTRYGFVDDNYSLLHISVLSFLSESDKSVANGVKKAASAIEKQMRAVFPFAVSLPIELASRPSEELCHAGLALYQAAQIKASMSERKALKAKPRALTL